MLRASTGGKKLLFFLCVVLRRTFFVLLLSFSFTSTLNDLVHEKSSPDALLPRVIATTRAEAGRSKSDVCFEEPSSPE